MSKFLHTNDDDAKAIAIPRFHLKTVELKMKINSEEKENLSIKMQKIHCEKWRNCMLLLFPKYYPNECFSPFHNTKKCLALTLSQTSPGFYVSAVQVF